MRLPRLPRHLLTSSFSSSSAAASTGVGPNRFYKNVTVHTDHTSPARHAIHLDGRVARTSHRTPLSLAHHPLALALAHEWDAQTNRIRPSSMPLFALLSFALDRVPHIRASLQSDLLANIHTDAIAVRPPHPLRLVQAQDAALAPVETVLRRMHISFAISRHILPAKQPAPLVRAVEQRVLQLDDLQLAALHSAASSCKSVAIALALCSPNGVDAEVAVNAARSEEIWQANVWGQVEGGHDIDEADLRVRVTAADFVFRCVEQQQQQQKQPQQSSL